MESKVTYKIQATGFRCRDECGLFTGRMVVMFTEMPGGLE